MVVWLAWLTACQTAPEANPAGSVASVALQATATPTAAPLTPTAAGVTVEELPLAPSETPPATQYPAPNAQPATATRDPYPGPSPSPTGTAGDPYPVAGDAEVFLPITGGSQPPAPTATPIPSPTATAVPPTPVPTVDFAARRAELQANGQDLGFAKLGFHVTLLEERDLLDDWMQRLDAAGVPFFLKTVDNAEPLFRAQELMKQSGVPHVLVYRASGGVPHYELPPEQAAQIHWESHRSQFPPELDPSLVWIETLNEPDRLQSEWLGRFALETARLAMAEGFRWAAFGWASGEPEPEQWQTPSMLAFLRLAGENPDKLAIALHEYSYTHEEIGHDYPYKIGRFQELFRIADAHGIPRPTVLITEFGWEYAEVPEPEQAMRDLRWAARLYAPYPQVKGAAIWNLGIGCCYDDVSEETARLVAPLTEYSLTKYFAVPQPPAQQPIDPNQFAP